MSFPDCRSITSSPRSPSRSDISASPSACVIFEIDKYKQQVYLYHELLLCLRTSPFNQYHPSCSMPSLQTAHSLTSNTELDSQSCNTCPQYYCPQAARRSAVQLQFFKILNIRVSLNILEFSYKPRTAQRLNSLISVDIGACL